MLSMPTIVRERGYRIFFYMADRMEPPHIYVVRQECAAKLWLERLEFEGRRLPRARMPGHLRDHRRASRRVPAGVVSDLQRVTAMNELRIKSVSLAGESMTTEFSNGHSFAVPVSSLPRLHGAPAADREYWELIGRGLGVHWEACDEDLSVENILLAYSRTKTADYALAAQA